MPYEKLNAPQRTLAGHPGVASVGTLGGKRVVAFAGRAHLYQGYSAMDVTYFVRLASAAGAKTIVLTNAAGGLNPDYERGDVMLISDHINLTGESGVEPSRSDPFLSMIDAYTPHLRVLAREHASTLPLREGIYAGVRGPQYETPAESEALRRMGADAVGMSTVLETMMARSLGLDVLGISLITNVIGPQIDVSHADVLAASREGGASVAAIVEGLLGAL